MFQIMSFKRLLAVSTFLFASMSISSFASVQYKIDGASLTPLSGPPTTGSRVKIDRIPVDGRFETFELERFEVFAKDADIKVLGAHDEILEVVTPLRSVCIGE
jgi:hypothetical protein